MTDPQTESALKRWVFKVYLAVLLCSYCFQWLGPPNQTMDSIVQSIGTDSRPLLVLLHGSRDNPESLDKLRDRLAGNGEFEVFVPQLPLTHAAGNSPRLQAATLLSIVPNDRPVHVLAIGYSSAVALTLIEMGSDSLDLKSVTLLSSRVTPKFELLGDPSLNRALKAFQFGVLFLAEHLIPHFGYWDNLGFNPEFADVELATELAEIEILFENSRIPILILEKQSNQELIESYQKVRPDFRFILHENTEHADQVADDFLRFLDDVEREKVETHREPTMRFEMVDVQSLHPWVAGTLLALATFASEDFACIGGGLLASRGSTTFTVALLGCILGIFIGDFFIYLLGRALGPAALKMPILNRLGDASKLESYSTWFESRGISLIVVTRFLPGSRVPTYFAAGVLKISVLRFGTALFVASIVWTPILVGLSYFFGEQFLEFFEGLGGYSWVGIAIFVIVFLIGSRLFVKAMTWKGRRLLYSKYQRLTRWEFWPIAALYPPVICYIAWLMLKYRSLTLPSIVNPCMPASGLVFESKSQILGHLNKFGAPVAQFILIPFNVPVETKLKLIETFMTTSGLNFPIVLKPDVGQRGQGVLIAKSIGSAKEFFASQVEDTIAQEYVSGVEYGVFYHRAANAKTGVVSSITDKRLISVVGDGESTLEQLILRDPRAVCMATYFLREFEGRLDEVIGKDVEFQLTSVGTHCRGAMFLDGEKLITEELIDTVDGFSAPIEGFHFGRYDLRAPSVEAFKAGQGLKIIELNGLTSEPTNMYDPKHSVFFAWSTLMKQWQLIFKLAKENRLAGHEPDSVKSIIRLTKGYLRGSSSRDLS